MGKWQNIPPDQKPNWARMNEGQRRYAYEQYNLALVRRGINHNHPVPDGDQPYNHRGDFDIDQVINRPHPDEQQVAREIDNDTGDIDPSAEEVLGNLPDAPEDSAQEFDESLLEGDNQGNIDTRYSDMADSSVVTPKRGSSEQGGSNPKRGLFQDGAGSSQLPGTAQGQGGNNLGEDSVRPFRLPRPTIHIADNVRYFRKTHRFFTYGFAYRPLASGSMHMMTTPLAYVPWDQLYFYLNPSEFELLPPQSSVKNVRVRVYQRNVRVAFPTNSTNTALATLNQNKNIVYGIGLNKKIDSINIKYTSFAANQPMMPTAFVYRAATDSVEDADNWYGSAGNVFTVAPRHQLGQPDVLYSYLGMYYINAPAVHDGWECLQSHIVEGDADASSGGLLVECKYSPKVGICRPPHTQVNRSQFPGTRTINRGSHSLNNHNQVINITADGVTEVTESIAAMNQVFTPLTTLIQPLEKSQMYSEGIFQRDKPQVQDSLHIGVQPTYALTSTNTTVNQSFTDTQAYFEVVAEAWIDTSYPTFRPLTQHTNVHMSNPWFRNTRPLIESVPLLDGLYTSVNP